MDKNCSDSIDEYGCYFGQMSRSESHDLLMAEKENGTYLIRDSLSIPGYYVLSLKENTTVNHYVIQKLEKNYKQVYIIGDQIFPNMHILLEFCKWNFFHTQTLTKPAVKPFEYVIAMYDFYGNDDDDLSFRKGDILIIEKKYEEKWWKAKNEIGQSGSIPVPYVQKVKLPVLVRVKKAYIPNEYDKTAIKLEIGNFIKVTKIHNNGQWEGESVDGKGCFPYTHVEFIDLQSNLSSSDH